MKSTILIVLLVLSVLFFVSGKPPIQVNIRKSGILNYFNDSLITAKDLIKGLKHKGDVKEISVELLSYYYDTVKRSGICLYYTTYFYYHRTTPGGIRWLNGKPFAVLTVINNKEIHYFSGNVKSNQKLLNDLKTNLPQMPDSLVKDSGLLNDFIKVDD
jgi:hypothetical protein